MPHTNRKKKSSPTTVPGENKKKVVVHTKRKEVLDEEGWVHVVDTPRTRRSTVSKDAKSLHAGDFEVDGVQYINRTLDEMREEFGYWKKSWETDNASADLKKALEGKEGSGVKKCVVLGLGSLQSARREGRRASFTQLAALETLLSIIGLSPPAICREMLIGSRREDSNNLPRTPVHRHRQTAPARTRIRSCGGPKSVQPDRGEQPGLRYTLLCGCVQESQRAEEAGCVYRDGRGEFWEVHSVSLASTAME